jgi:enoyl-CoA hydratase
MKHIQVEHLGSKRNIAVVTLDRPTVRNAFNTEMAEELLSTFKHIAEGDAAVVVLASSNEKAFCTGADLKERDDMTEEQWKNQHKLFEDMFNSIYECPQLVIAAVDGYALAGGFELALNCDMIVAAETSVFGLPEVTRGIMPGGGASRLLPKRVGVHKAKEWLTTGRLIKAEEVNAAGLLNKLATTDNLRNECMELAEAIAKNAPLAVQACKEAADHLFGMPHGQAYEQEIVYYNRCVNTEDRLEGVRAFVEKRPPEFKGK